MRHYDFLLKYYIVRVASSVSEYSHRFANFSVYYTSAFKNFNDAAEMTPVEFQRDVLCEKTRMIELMTERQ